MLAYFPVVYPGELLYSALARWLRHQGAAGQTLALNNLFGHRFAAATVDLPGDLSNLAARIPRERGLNADLLVDQMTLFRYYTAFVPPTLQTSARAAMLTGHVDGLHLRLGISAFRIHRPLSLRFCAECAVEMTKAHGELYWRREHQLPSALVCAEHGRVLQESLVLLPARGRHEFVAATATTCPRNAPHVAQLSSLIIGDRLRALSERSAALLLDQSDPRTFAGWTAHYRGEMVRAGLASSAMRMRQAQLEVEFRNHFGPCLDLFPGVLDKGVFAGDWLATMVRRHRKIAHPLLHLMLQQFLDSKQTLGSAFGAGPWPCLNPLARHRASAPVTNVSVHGNRGHRVGVFACSCGYVYTRRLNTNTGTLEAPRFWRFGPLLQPTLARLVAQRQSLRKIARELHIDPKTVAKLAAEHGIRTPWGMAVRASIPVTVPRPTEIRRRVKQQVPRKVTPRAPRRDWSAIDATCSYDVAAVVSDILASVPPARVTYAEVERRMGRREWMQSRLDKLPRTRATLAKVIESLEAFQLRRIRWAAKELERTRTEVRAWQVMRKAGVRSHLLPAIRAALDRVGGDGLARP